MSNRAALAVVTSRLRVEEKLIFAALEARGAAFERVDDAALQLEAGHASESPWPVVWNRSLSFGRTLYATQILEQQGALCVNSAHVVGTCGDKAATSLAFAASGVPTPRTLVAFTVESALEACETLGYPCVLKPVVGSWGRLVARLDSTSAAEAVLEDRAVLGSWQHSVFYLQEYVEKPGRDARVFVVGDECIAAIWRHSEHWITNTARGGRVEAARTDGPLGEMAVRAARAVGGGILAVDLIEAADGLQVLEVNHSGEFRNSIAPTGVDIPGAMADWVLGRVAERVAQEVFA
ncbi:Alpha-aminoadipate--LysW ligase LysX [Planctomycetes bacterium Poly30]|uniref:Alpha-aminoadipate--LysW ligase LysX n=1 Tax=Saltatorellus ferox TaxID=2528018 RepID=A0A518EYN2_9BACT|nr:Alpha-aminoadipate--LysW ligase LysX [Planctomycetes bacterium Poly30]